MKVVMAVAYSLKQMQTECGAEIFLKAQVQTLLGSLHTLVGTGMLPGARGEGCRDKSCRTGPRVEAENCCAGNLEQTDKCTFMLLEEPKLHHA